jgi:two-component system sensor kinase FixL
MRLDHPRTSGARLPAEPLLDEHAERLVRTPVATLPEALSAALEAFARRVRCDRAGLWEVQWDARRMTPIQQWTADGGMPLASVPADAVPWLVQQLAEARAVTYRNAASLPREASRERRWTVRNGPRSAALVPIVIGGATAGVFLVGTMRRERTWGASTLAFLRRAAVVLAAPLVRRFAHEASLGTEGRLAGILEAGPGGILLALPSGQIDLANGQASTLFRRTRGDLCRQRLQELLAPASDTPGRPRRGVLDALLASGEPLRMLAHRGDGTTLPVEVTLREVRAPGEAHFCCGVREVSDDLRAREEAAQLRDQIALRGRIALLAEMGSGIAHELNQPLTAILSNSETAQRLIRARAPDAATLAETLQDVVNDTRRAAEILGGLRDMLRHRPSERLPVDVAELVDGVARRFHEESVVRELRITSEMEPGLPRVLGDRVQLEQVLMNLVLNACEALDAVARGPRVIVVRARRAKGGVALADSGPGLSEEALARAFDAFFTTKPRGLGVGLAITRSIVEAHGGRILARNNPDRGATFELEIPSAPLAAVAEGGGEHA